MMFLPFTVAATVLSLFSEVPLLLQATKSPAVRASTVAALINLAVVCTLDSCSFKDLWRLLGRCLLDHRENGLL
jgi:hypothetical protein